jgi:uncharacterized membrane-anchored protein
MKKFKYLLHHYDAIWSVPLAFATFFLVGYFLSSMGIAVGTYDIGFIQPLFLAGAVVIGATFMAVMGIRFTFYTIYKYIYGRKCDDGDTMNFSKKDWRKLTAVQRYFVSGFLFVFFVSMIIIVYLKFI